MRSLLVFIALFITSGCGYFMSGTWEDDPDNWERAFYSSKPDGVIVTHSKYTRFAHWSDEYIYFFEIEHNDSLLNHLIREFELVNVLIGSANFTEAMEAIGEEAPAWFIPKMMKKYELWTYKDFDQTNFRLFLDTETKSIFLYNRQF